MAPPAGTAPSSPPAAVSLTMDGDVAVIQLDDGKANALSHAVIEALGDALATAGREARAIALVGREGRFCAGFDLTVMRAGPAEAWTLLNAGVRLAADLYLAPVPVVAGCTGHALAMGGILLMASDARIGAEGPFKLGMNEVAIGMPMPRFAALLAHDRLAPTHLTASLQLARIFDPAGAVAAGFLDELVPAPAVAERAVEHARELAAQLDPTAFRMTRAVLRGGTRERWSKAMEEDLVAAESGQT